MPTQKSKSGVTQAANRPLLQRFVMRGHATLWQNRPADGLVLACENPYSYGFASP